MSYPDLVGKSDNEILSYFKHNKEDILRKTEAYGEKLRHKWNKTGKTFFKQVEEITGFKWKHRTYKCHLSSTFVCCGCYDAQKGNIISVFPKLEDKYLLDTFFHELVHLHFWDTLDELGVKHSIKERSTAKGRFWDLSEVAVNYPLQRLKIKDYKAEFHIYPQHKKLWNKIKKYWDLSFRDFILKSVEEIQK